ncbi:Glycerol-3-phosphate acyltransferase [Candidatus Purcelliella pentastirinorum]|uniref:Glycerol-3-phosphate acyltransferase n=1 Tax=Candidatus Purcelliella pentastirinorum TaxID=472834 RepID=A0A346DZS1_9ENTR|nr:glycerol-3-phosphate 1-O-acyltransferase PlsB [Candidatus Purcelliella pentastirinorum]AXN02226.1 Glycerol-3-phosphate acyltransferase [Candidatus Purcelliella pentastirinorum]
MIHKYNIYNGIINLLLNICINIKTLPKYLNKIKKKQKIIYILQKKSKIDLLILKKQCYKQKLPDPTESIKINNKKIPRCIFINNTNNKFLFYIKNKKNIELINKYIKLEKKNFNLNFKILPILIFIGRKPKYKKNKNYKNKNITKTIKIIKKILQIIWIGKETFIIFSKEISLKNISLKNISKRLLIKKLIYKINTNFNKQKFATIGPNIIKRNKLFKKILKSKTIKKKINKEIKKKNKKQKKIKSFTLSIIKEIATNFSYEMIRIVNRIMKIIWNKTFDKIIINGNKKICKLAYKGNKIIYLPCHKSHIDYLILSYAIYHQGLSIPYIAAGTNLNFWPIGYLFRKLGAFFIRRTFIGNKLYSIIFKEYLIKLIKRGHSIEYFIEGSRSRTGYLLKPKTGILTITIKSLLKNINKPIILVPIYINYDHIMEVKTYTKEMSGHLKKNENILQILKGIKNIKNMKNFGNSYINFGEPLNLIKYLNKNVKEWKQNLNFSKSKNPNWLIPTAKNIANNIMNRINAAVAANSTNLCAIILLSVKKYQINKIKMIEQIKCYIKLFKTVPYSKYFTFPKESAKKILNKAIKTNKFRLKKNKNCDLITLNENINILNYYKNNIQHIFIIPSLIIKIIQKYKKIKKKEIIDKINIIYPILKNEFYLYLNKKKINKFIIYIIKEFINQKLIIQKKLIIYINKKRNNQTKILSTHINDILKKYITIISILKLKPNINTIDLYNKSKILINYQNKNKKINKFKLYNKQTLLSSLKTLKEIGYIKNKKYKEKIKNTYNLLNKLIKKKINL